jgi:opacity protein-like surface antigen
VQSHGQIPRLAQGLQNPFGAVNKKYKLLEESRLRHPLKLALVLTCCLVGCSSFALASETNLITAEPQTARECSFDIVPYLWLATYDGTFGLPDTPAGVPPTHSDAAFSTHINAVVMLAAQFRYRDVGLFFDGAWLQLQTEGGSGTGLYSGTDIKSDIAFGTLALTYRLPPLAKLQTDVFAGARTWHVSNELEFKPGLAPGFTTDASITWSDPLIGAKLNYDLTRHWFGSMIEDVGGFGVGSQITWEVYGGVGYRFTDWLSAQLGYRYMHVDYDQGGSLMNVNIQGFLIGLGFHF